MYLIYSNDHFLLNKTINKLFKQLNVEQNYEKEKFSLVHNDLKEIYTSLTTYSLFGQQKIIIIEDAWCFTEEKISLNKTYDEAIIEKIINHQTENIVIFVLNNDKVSKRLRLCKLISEKGQVSLVKPMSDQQIQEFILKSFEKFQKKISSQDLEYLLQKLPNNMQSINSEIQKLINIDNNTISRSDIDANISKYIENDIFELSECFTKNDTSRFISLYKDYLLINDDIIGLIALLNSNVCFFRDVQILKELKKSPEEIASILSSHPYRVKIAFASASSSAQLNEKLKLIYKLQKSIVNQTVDKENIAEYLFIKNMSQNAVEPSS